ncbi:hypothetical protein Tsubulata_044789, partial [Turnera subulata]
MEYGWVGNGSETAITAASFGRSWAQQTEESYQLQLALALRVSSQAALANDPNLLDSCASNDTVSFSASSSSSSSAAESMSHRFWVNGSLSYSDKIPDGFYVLHGVDPYTWTLCTDHRDIGQVPSLELLKALDPRADLSIRVVVVDTFRDQGLKELHKRVIGLCSSWIPPKDVIHQLADIVCNQMGGVAFTEEEAFGKCWKERCVALKNRLGSVVFPIGSLSVGLCVHRAVLFKVLADSINLPCRIAKGCKYCRRDVASSCLVRIGSE